MVNRESFSIRTPPKKAATSCFALDKRKVFENCPMTTSVILNINQPKKFSLPPPTCRNTSTETLISQI